MANLTLFEERLKALLLDQVPPEVSERVSRMCDRVEGMCNEQTLAMLNMAVSECLDEDETYLEIGTWNGRSVITALQGNDARAVVIDPLEFDNSAIDFPANAKGNGVWDRINLFQMRWEDYLVSNTPPKIGVYLYDGDHGTESSYNGVNAFLPFLADEAIIIVDDTDMEPVEEDMARWVAENKENIVFHYEVSFWMGQTVIGYKKS